MVEEPLLPEAPEPEDVAEWLRIVHPPEGARLPAIQSTFVYGYADPQGRLFLNGREVAIHPEGGFLAMIPLSPGSFAIEAELWLEEQRLAAGRNVFVSAPAAPSPVSPLTIEYVRPNLSWLVRPGDEVSILLKGSPGMEAYFSVDGVRGRVPMAESSPSAGGIYRSTYVARDGDRLRDSRVQVIMVDPSRSWRNKQKQFAEGSISLLPDSPPRVVEVTSPHAVLRAQTAVASWDAAGYAMFPPPGVRLEVVGRRGEDLKIRLSQNRIGWIWEKETRALPPGTPLPRTTAGSLSVAAGARNTTVRIRMP